METSHISNFTCWSFEQKYKNSHSDKSKNNLHPLNKYFYTWTRSTLCLLKLQWQIFFLGGLSISSNAFHCGCHLAWLGHWLRRWTRESVHSHNVPVKTALEIYEAAKDATCIYNDRIVPILELSPEDITCQASALSNSSQPINDEMYMCLYTLMFCLFFKCQ